MCSDMSRRTEAVPLPRPSTGARAQQARWARHLLLRMKMKRNFDEEEHTHTHTHTHTNTHTHTHTHTYGEGRCDGEAVYAETRWGFLIVGFSCNCYCSCHP